VFILRRLSVLTVLFMLTRDQARVPLVRPGGAGVGVGAKPRALPPLGPDICSDDRLFLHPSILVNLGGESEWWRSKLRRGGDNGMAIGFDWGVPSRVGELSSCAVLA
jgi:hypothetical protein